MNINNIIVIEDDLFQLKLMMRMLSKITNANIYSASNGQQALDKLCSIENPDIIFCDLSMPEMDGVEFLRIMATKKIDCHIVVISSAADDVLKSVINMAKSYGLANIHMLPKPIGLHHLQVVFDKIIVKKVATVHAPVSDYQASRNELVRALHENEFHAFYQPQINARSCEIIGAEALCRWYHPTRGVLTPNYFIDQLTELGLLGELTFQVMESAIKSCAQWHKLGYQYKVSVNVSPLDLVNLNFANRVFSLLDRYGLAENYLNVEITETDICPNIAKALETVARLRIKGVNISIDDFGTGYSSLQQLITSPFTELKIDQVFVRRMLTNPKHLAAVTFSLQLAKSFGLMSVAEGVETAEEAAILTELGCDVFQGYLFSPALEESKFLEWANRFSCDFKHCKKA